MLWSKPLALHLPLIPLNTHVVKLLFKVVNLLESAFELSFFVFHLNVLSLFLFTVSLDLLLCAAALAVEFKEVGTDSLGGYSHDKD